MSVFQDTYGKGNQLLWRPTLKQEQFLAVPLTIKEGFFGGSVGGGKSDVLMMYPIVHGWFRHPRFKGLYLRRTMPELRNEIIPRARDYFVHLGAKFNSNEGVYTFPSGALFFFGHCEHEDDVHKYDSMEINYLAFDELTSFLEYQYIYLTYQRVRTSEELLKEGLPEICRSGSMPGGVGHSWTKKRFIDPAPDGGKVLKGRGNTKRIFIRAGVNDNPHISEQYKKDLDALPEAERQAKKFGSWTAYEGQVFSEFRAKHYPSEPDNALHVIEPFEIPAAWPKVVSIDWGYSAMTWVGYGAVSPFGRLYIYREQSFVREKIEEWAPKVRHYIDLENPRDIVICHSAGQDRGQPHTIQQQVSVALDRPLSLSVKDRVGTKALLHEYLRWQPKTYSVHEQEPFDNNFANWLMRNKGLDAYKLYLKSYEPHKPETNIPKLFFFKNCTLVIDAISSCVYDKTRVEDVAEFPGDDPYDGLRYLIAVVDRYFDEAAGEFKKLQNQEVIYERLKTTQDYTQFYRQMEAAERFGEKETGGHIPRYRHHVH